MCYNSFVVFGTIPQCPANHARPSRAPSNPLKIFPPASVIFSPTARAPNSFSCNTYGFPRKCCKQKAYGRSKSFSCNTYKKHGGLLKDRTLYLSSLSRLRLGQEVRFPPVTSHESPACHERERGGTCC